jgi:hypothetical protein
MGQTNYFKILSIIAFIAFAIVSCWATAESLHLLLSSWPLIFCWVVTVGFFIIASIGTKLIVDSLNQNIHIENRGLKLIGGILITIIFWLLCIMPTNTHTFFFRNAINDKVSMDIATTQNYLDQIKSNQITVTKINAESSELRNNLQQKLGELKAEIFNDANPGLGTKAKSILEDFAEILSVAKIEPLSYKGTSIQDRDKLYNAYRSKFYILLASRLEVLNRELTPPNNNHVTQADQAYRNLELVKKYIDNGRIDLNDAEDIKTVCDKLNAGYSTVKAYPQFVDFKNSDDKEAYTAPNPVTKVKRMTSVFDVWEDFLKGVYAGHGFLFWVIISILVDIAAFIFFDISFKKQD